MKIFFSISIAISVLLLAGCGGSRPSAELTNEAAALHRSMVTIDTHTDTPLRLMRRNYDPALRHEPAGDEGQVDFPRMKEGGLDAVFFAAFIGQGPRTAAGNTAAREAVTAIIDTVHAVLGRNQETVSPALAAADASRIKAEGKRALYIGIENGYAIGGDLSLIQQYYDRGVRYITLCHSKNNDISDSSTDRDTVKYNGLSTFGARAVREMNDIGMIVDISHVSDKAFYDVLALSAAPVIASHSCARALCNSPRNMDDDMLRALSGNGGVIQVCFVSEFLTPPPAVPDVFDVVDHIDHIVNVAGIDHVGIGTDFDGGGKVSGCSDVSEMKNITIELLRRGYTHEAIQKIWGGNFLRVFARVEACARRHDHPVP